MKRLTLPWCALTMPRLPSLGTASRHPPAASQAPRLKEEGEAAVLGRCTWTHFIPISRLGRGVEWSAELKNPWQGAHSARLLRKVWEALQNPPILDF